jgi:siroheme synthase-like protein
MQQRKKTLPKQVEAFLRADARLTVISPKVTAVIERLAAAGHLQLVSRPYARGDLRGFYLAYAATGVSAVDEQIARDAESEQILLSATGGRSIGNFISPPAVKRGDLTIAISTNGRSPGFARLIKKKLEGLIGPEYGDLLDIVEAERLVMHNPRPSAKSGKSLPNKAASQPR